MVVDVLSILYKYGEINEKKVLNFSTKEEAKDYVSKCVPIDEEPTLEDFLDFDSPVEDFEYFHKKWLFEKNSTKDSVKWFQEFYLNGELLGKGLVNL